MKAAYPEKFNSKSDVFRTWCEEFEGWMEAESGEAAKLLKAAKVAKNPVTMPDGEIATDLKFAYSHMRKLMTDKEPKNIVRNVRRRNALEAYRLLNRRFCPRTAAEKSRALRRCTNFGVNH